MCLGLARRWAEMSLLAFDCMKLIGSVSTAGAIDCCPLESRHVATKLSQVQPSASGQTHAREKTANSRPSSSLGADLDRGRRSSLNGIICLVPRMRTWRETLRRRRQKCVASGQTTAPWPTIGRIDDRPRRDGERANGHLARTAPSAILFVVCHVIRGGRLGAEFAGHQSEWPNSDPDSISRPRRNSEPSERKFDGATLDSGHLLALSPRRRASAKSERKAISAPGTSALVAGGKQRLKLCFGSR